MQPLIRWAESQRPTARRLVVVPLLTLFVGVGLVLARSSVGAVTGGPVVVLGIAAENGGPGFQGDPQTVWAPLVQNIYNQRTNGGTGILVLGAGKLNLPILTDQVSAFWNAVGPFLTGAPLTYVNGGPAITGQSFVGYGMVVVVSSESIAASGGLNQAEETALEGRSSDFADFVNGGGGVFGLTQIGFANPFFYLGGIGTFVHNFLVTPYNDIQPTIEGTDVGITHGPTVVTDPLDTCCWREDFTDWPAFMDVLALGVHSEDPLDLGNPVALGGAQVVITLDPPTTTTSTTVASTTTSTSPATTLPPTTPTTMRPTTTLPGGQSPVTSTTVRVNATTSTTRFPTSPPASGVPGRPRLTG